MDLIPAPSPEPTPGSGKQGQPPPRSNARPRSVLRHGSADLVKKGEDFHLALADCQHGPTSFGVFGVFDGHQGTAAAMFARDNLMSYVLEHIPEDAGEEKLLEMLPKALAEGFMKCHHAFAAKDIPSGTTATVAIITGWTVTVAAVGDSQCFLETARGGTTELSVSHRLEDNAEEQKRILDEGGELSRLKSVDGQNQGPLRSWPGGLCVSRSIGDIECGPLIIPLPHVKQVTIPSTAGGRLVIGSDGLWDAVQLDKASKVHRGQTAEAAAAALMKESIKLKGMHDDVTVVVVDIIPCHTAAASKNTCHVRKGGSPAKGFFKMFTLKKKAPESRIPEDSPPGDNVPLVLSDQDSMHGSDLYERYQSVNVSR